MSTPIVLELAVGRLVDAHGRGPDSPLVAGLTDVVRIAQVAEAAGVAGLRLLDAVPGFAVLDPTVVVSFLAGRTSELGYLPDVPTTHHAPYNLARRILSIDRATGGRAGLVLRPGEGDEVTSAVVPDVSARDPKQRWCEYAEILRRLWDSFPADALVGDQKSGIFVRDELIHPAGFDGRFYRVSGPLDGPSSVQGRPPGIDADWLSDQVTRQSLDGLVLTVNGSTHELLALVENAVSRLVAPRPTRTLRDALGLSPVAPRGVDAEREGAA